MRTLKLLAVSGLIAATMSPALAAVDANTGADTVKAPSAATKSFLQNAGVGGKFEVDSSNIALQKSSSDSIKSFAQKMVDDHTKASDELKATAKTEGYDNEIPADLDSKHQAIIDKLDKDPAGAKFDRDYIKAQSDAHKETIAVFTKYSKAGDDQALKDFATSTLPTLQEHKSMIPTMKAGK